MNLPLGEKATASTGLEWLIHRPFHRPLILSQNRILLSLEHEIIRLPFGEKASDDTGSVWHLGNLWPLATCHNRTSFPNVNCTRDRNIEHQRWSSRCSGLEEQLRKLCKRNSVRHPLDRQNDCGGRVSRPQEVRRPKAACIVKSGW